MLTGVLKSDTFDLSTFLITSSYIPLKLNKLVYNISFHENVEKLSMDIFY